VPERARGRSAEAVDAWLLDQWSASAVTARVAPGGPAELSADAGPVFPASKLYAIADYLMRDSNGRISKRSAMRTLEMLREYQDKAARASELS
jgi:hypothetical protein